MRQPLRTIVHLYKVKPTAIFGVEQNRQFPCSPCSLKAGSIMGNFEDNWLISSVSNCGKNHKNASKMEKKVLKFGSNSQKVPDK